MTDFPYTVLERRKDGTYEQPLAGFILHTEAVRYARRTADELSVFDPQGKYEYVVTEERE